jgi:hypothetical protein
MESSNYRLVNFSDIFFIYILNGDMSKDTFQEFLDSMTMTIQNAHVNQQKFALWIDTRQMQRSHAFMIKRIKHFIDDHETIFQDYSNGTVITFHQKWVQTMINTIFKIKPPKSSVWTGRTFNDVTGHLVSQLPDDFFNEGFFQLALENGIDIEN